MTDIIVMTDDLPGGSQSKDIQDIDLMELGLSIPCIYAAHTIWLYHQRLWRCYKDTSSTMAHRLAPRSQTPFPNRIWL